ncbi:MAG: hypothetical protein MK213_01700 [Planctomycetes bacterium]|nr:hypothetical protein [Planctomycetota bacterium]
MNPTHLIFGAGLFACTSCAHLHESRDFYAGVGASTLPNLGFSALYGQVVEHNGPFDRSLAVEVDATVQPWDDEDIAADGNPPAGQWTQFRVGLNHVAIEKNRRNNLRWGLTWGRAGEEPNLFDDAGDYFGVFGAWSQESRLGLGWLGGLEFSLAVMGLEGGGEPMLLPQIRWQVLALP